MCPLCPKGNSNCKRAQRGVVLLDVVAALAIVALAAFASPISIRDGVAMNWITSDRCPIRGGTRTLRFLADGRSCGGVMTLSASGREIELRVDWLTGRVEMSPK